ncbi:carbohydrate-binding module family 12 protein [Gelatoporia subvermispora B]|uniref:Carbohydrate-binding module family 12 protein n=1 Tax=Ceriporiopsis subvermispora (strain B) TaxID=914234 RepID=M2QSU1_CERS8|nr:carbohydrate-binding module family 12 protein [Gelatoporia subvermispora B]
MVYQWEPSTPYGSGAVVVYEGVKYQIIQPHTSEPGWEPPATPALWARLPEEVPDNQDPFRDNCNPGYQPSYEQPQAPPPQPPYGGPGVEEKRWTEVQEQQVEIDHEERKKKWWELDDDRKKQLEVGGGLLAGIAAIGAGYYAYHEHEKSEDEKKANVWALQNWLHEAEARTRRYYEQGPSGPANWVLTDGLNIPQGAIQGGEQQGQPLFIVRGFHEGSIQIGKVSPAYSKGAVIGYGHKEIQLPKYEVLCGDMRALQWVPSSGRVHLERLGARPVEGGHEADGTPLFVAQAETHDSIIPGKASEKLSGAFVTFRDTEKEVDEYRVLCYNY